MKRFNNNLFLLFFSLIATLLFSSLLIVNIVFEIQGKNNAIIIALLSLSLCSLIFFNSLILVLYYRVRLQRTNQLINSMNSIEFSQEEIFEIGIISYDEEQVITFITPWLQREGFYNYLGKKISKFSIDIESNKKQIMEFNARKWEVLVFRRNRTILLKDITYINSIKKLLIDQQKAILSMQVSFSKKIAFDDSIKTSIILNINQAIQEWTLKIKGIFNSSLNIEGKNTVIFNWFNGEEDILSENLLKTLRNAISKYNDEVTLSIGVAYGIYEVSEIFDKSLKALETSKNRGGDQIILEKPDGTTDYIGTSSSQAVASDSLYVKKFFSSFMVDVENAREIFITAHKMADLDALGSTLGLWQLIKGVKNDVYIILKEFDTTTKKLYANFSKNEKQIFISESKAKELISNKSHFFITDCGSIEATQASSLLKNVLPEKITVIDHHRLSKEKNQFDELKILIDTTISSASEIIVEMLKIYFGKESQDQIEKNVATSLLAGIYLDSKWMTQNITSATFDAVSYLISNNADSEEVERIFRQPQKLMKIEAEAMKNVNELSKGFLFTFISETKVISEEYTSIIANKLLNYDEVSATFVLAKVSEKRFKLSIRTNGNINAQDIAEQLGGGGHFNVSAVNWNTNIKFPTIKKRIISTINKVNKESKNA